MSDPLLKISSIKDWQDRPAAAYIRSLLNIQHSSQVKVQIQESVVESFHPQVSQSIDSAQRVKREASEKRPSMTQLLKQRRNVSKKNDRNLGKIIELKQDDQTQMNRQKDTLSYSLIDGFNKNTNEFVEEEEAPHFSTNQQPQPEDEEYFSGDHYEKSIHLSDNHLRDSQFCSQLGDSDCLDDLSEGNHQSLADQLNQRFFMRSSEEQPQSFNQDPSPMEEQIRGSNLMGNFEEQARRSALIQRYLQEEAQRQDKYIQTSHISAFKAKSSNNQDALDKSVTANMSILAQKEMQTDMQSSRTSRVFQKELLSRFEQHRQQQLRVQENQIQPYEYHIQRQQVQLPSEHQYLIGQKNYPLNKKEDARTQYSKKPLSKKKQDAELPYDDIFSKHQKSKLKFFEKEFRSKIKIAGVRIKGIRAQYRWNFGQEKHWMTVTALKQTGFEKFIGQSQFYQNQIEDSNLGMAGSSVMADYESSRWCRILSKKNQKMFKDQLKRLFQEIFTEILTRHENRTNSNQEVQQLGSIIDVQKQKQFMNPGSKSAINSSPKSLLQNKNLTPSKPMQNQKELKSAITKSTKQRESNQYQLRSFMTQHQTLPTNLNKWALK